MSSANVSIKQEEINPDAKSHEDIKQPLIFGLLKKANDPSIKALLE